MKRIVFLQLIMLPLVFALAIGINYGISAYQQRQSEHAWCSIINTITAHPVHKPSNVKANPSREASYSLYVDFIQRKKELGC